jgi:hypothetical protein
MCDFHSEKQGLPGWQDAAQIRTLNFDDLVEQARHVVAAPEVRRTAAGFIGYGSTKKGDRVLLGVDTHYDLEVVNAMASALRERGATVDIVVVDVGPDREFTDIEEITTVIRRRPWAEAPRRWEGVPWVEELALRGGYDLLIHGKGGGIPDTPHRYEAYPWLQREHFCSQASVYPRDLHTLINVKTWNMFYKKGQGGTVHLTDPEGTDITYTLWEQYFKEGRIGYGETPFWGHIMGHPATPILRQENASGVVRGTTSHFQRPFPQINVHLDEGRVSHLTGGGAYGDAWNELIEETKKIQYPCFPGPGLFWLWEVAIGTNPKIQRPKTINKLSSGGFEWERRRQGIIHTGFGTFWRGPEEAWAAERKIAYGHLHVHLLFPTLEITTKDNEKIKVIDRGRLTVIDDPEVRKLAERYGDPDEVLRSDWEPKIPGISQEGKYEDYAKDPARYIFL